MHLLLNANYSASQYHGHTINRGDVVIGLDSLAAKLSITVRNVRTALNHLKSTNEVTIKTTNKFSIVTICKFEFWQDLENENDNQNDKQSDKPLTNDRQTNDKQLTASNKGIEEIEKIKKEYDSLLFSAKDELLRVREEMTKEINALKSELENAKKERKQRAKPIPKTLGGFARAAFEEYYKTLKGIDYDWSAKDGNHMKMLLQKIQRSRENRETPLPCDDENMVVALKKFFEYITDPWILDHLDVSNINSKYNEIVAAARSTKCGTNMETGRIITVYDENKFKNKDFFADV